MITLRSLIRSKSRATVLGAVTAVFAFAVQTSKKTRAMAQRMITLRSMIRWKSRAAVLGAVAVVFAFAALAQGNERRAGGSASVTLAPFTTEVEK
jgi:hypothetical protein